MKQSTHICAHDTTMMHHGIGLLMSDHMCGEPLAPRGTKADKAGPGMVALQLVRMRAGLRLNSAEVLRKCFLRAAFEVALLPVQSSEAEYA